MYRRSRFKKERNGNSMEVVEILIAATIRRLENCEEVPAKSSRDVKKRQKTGNDEFEFRS